MGGRATSKKIVPDTALHAYNTLVRLPLPAAERAGLLRELHLAAHVTAPPEAMLAALVARGGAGALKELGSIPGFGRRRLANLRRALSRRPLPSRIQRLLRELTQTDPAIPPVEHPHPLGEDAQFPPLIARALSLEGTTVRGEPAALERFPFSDPRIVHFREAARRPAPRAAVIIGGGYVGVEIAYAWARAGSKVTIVDDKRQILAGYIPRVVDQIARWLREAGVGLVLEAEATGWAVRRGKLVVLARTWSGRVTLPADLVLVAVGVREDEV